MHMKDVCISVSTYIQTKILIVWMAKGKQYFFLLILYYMVEYKWENKLKSLRPSNIHGFW